MTLTDAQIFEFIRQPYCKDEIAQLQKLCKEYRAQVTGKDAKTYLPDLPQYERDELKVERLKMMLSNVDLLSRVLKPRNRIFSAKGGVEHFIITSQNDEKLFRELIENITHGLSLKSWIQQVVMKRNDYDPNGIIVVEIDANKKVYPCFKSILEIHDRQLNGRIPEYLILTLSKKQIDKLKKSGIIPNSSTYSEGKVFRVIDDARDLIIFGNKILSERKNFAPKFPGIVSSNIYGDEDGIFYSPISDVFDLLKQYLLRSSLYNVVFARQAFPKEWMQSAPCANCAGIGKIDSLTCPECNGSKVQLSLKHSDVYIADWSGGKDGAGSSVPIPPMGHVDSPIESLEFFDSNLEGREDKIHYGIWGMYKSDKISSIHAGVTREAIGSNVEPTAYQAMLNSQPMVTQLVEFSKWYVGIYKHIADIVGYYKFPKTYRGSAIMGGDRFMIESPDATWDRYLKAVQAKAPKSELDSILIEYIENKYCNNPKLYRKYILLLGAEPFIHDDIATVLTWDIPNVQKMEKIYFPEWVNSMTEWEFMAIADGLNMFDEQEYTDDGIQNAEYEDDVADESDVDEVVISGGAAAVGVGGEQNPVKNLKDSLRKFTLAKMKDDAGLAKPTVTDAGIAIPTNSTLLQIAPSKPEVADKLN